MGSDPKAIEKDAGKLSHRERARLALRLIESLDPGKEEDVDELWLSEAERRLKEYDSGKTKARNVDDVLAEIEQQLK